MNCMRRFMKLQIARPSCVRCYNSITGRKKFYKTVSITQDQVGFEINLDQKKLRSPSGNVLSLPNEILAEAVALEWDSQCDLLKYHTMPVTNLCFYATDKPSGDNKSVLVDTCMKFLETDTILFRSDEVPGLADFQLKEWGGVINWARDRFKVKLVHTMGFTIPDLPEETNIVFRNHLQSYNFWALIGFENMTSSLKSLLLSIALVERHITVEEAVSLSRLEIEYQITKWGNVEWHHDIDLLDSRSKAAACTLFIHSCSEDSRTINLNEVL